VTIDWGRLRSLERSDLTLTMGATDDQKLVGFALYIVAEHFHHMGLVSAVCDTLAVTVDYRGRQIGSRLVKAAEPLLRQRHVKLVSHGHRACYGKTPMFPRLGYKLEELIYMKELH
jgi:predicted N-acetyltransferase YhbS